MFPVGRELAEVDENVRRHAGALKISVGKFYRPSGKAIQVRGVIPDVRISGGRGANVRRLEGCNPLPFDEVEAVPGFEPLAQLKSAIDPPSGDSQRRALEEKLDSLRKQPAIALDETRRRAGLAEIEEILARLDKLSKPRSDATVLDRLTVEGEEEIAKVGRPHRDRWPSVGSDGDVAIRVLLELAGQAG